MSSKIALQLAVPLISLLTGTAQAKSLSLQLVYIPLHTPCRIVDTRGFSSPFEANKLTQPFRAWGNQAQLDSQRDTDTSNPLPACEPVAGQTPAAMAANITVAAKRYQAQGNIVVYPSGNAAPASSLINFHHNNIANASIISLSNDPDQQFEIQAQLLGDQPDNQHKADVMVDVAGYFYDPLTLDSTTAASGLTYVPLASPCRIVDTRGFDTALTEDNPTQSFLAWGSKAELDAQRDTGASKQHPACEPVPGAIPSAMASNVTVAAKHYQAKGNIVTYPSGRVTPDSSLLNFDRNNIANAAIVSLNPENDRHFNVQARLFGHAIENQKKADVVIDVMGYFYQQTQFSGLSDRPDMAYSPLPTPCRITDTRVSATPFEQTGRTTQAFPAWSSPITKQSSACIPQSITTAGAVVANMTVVAQPYHTRGNMTAYAYGATQISNSLVNFNNNNIANASILSLNPDSNNQFVVEARLFGHQANNQPKADVVIDAMGYFHPMKDTPTPTSGSTQRISISNSGVEGSLGSISTASASISANGQFIAFRSDADNLVAEDSNNQEDIFVHDRHNGETQRISIASDGTQANEASFSPSISANGRFVAFASDASNLVTGDSNDWADIFVHDRQSGDTRRVSVASDGSQGDFYSLQPSISANGRFIAFLSQARNLVNGDSNGQSDIFVHDRDTGKTQRVSIASDGSQGDSYAESPTISADGQLVVFSAYSSNLVDSDSNDQSDIFIHDRHSSQTHLISVASNGTQNYDRSGSINSQPTLSADGRFVAYVSESENLSKGGDKKDIFIQNLQTDEIQLVSVASDGRRANLNSDSPSISADGRFVAFTSYASNLVAGDSNGWVDVFIHDRENGVTRRISVASDGTQSNLNSAAPTISADGGFVAFHSLADNLVTGDNNNSGDIFVRQIAPWD